MASSNRTREVVDRAKEVGVATASVVGQVGASTASAVGSGVRQGLASAKAQIDRAGEHLEAEDRRWDERKAGTDMPGIGASDPLGDLAVRLDRQADFFRELAVDAMRPGPVRMAMIALVGVLALLTAALGVVVVMRAFVGGGTIESLGPLVAAVATAGVATSIVGWVVERGRAAVAHEALARAEDAEARLCRTAELIALEKHDRAALVAVLSRREEERSPRTGSSSGSVLRPEDDRA